MVGGTLYRAAPGMKPSALETSDSLDVATMDLEGAVTSDAIAARDLDAGRWDGAELELFVTDWTSAEVAPVMVARGSLGAIERRGPAFAAELQGVTRLLDRPVCPATSPSCRAMLGDRACRVDLAPLTHARRVVAVDGRTATLDGAAPGMAFGELIWMEGANCGLASPVIAVEAAVLHLAEAPPFGQQTSRVAGGVLREERIDLPAVLPATSARALAQRLAAAAADGRETLLYRADLAALALTVGHVVAMDDGSRWRLAGRTVRASEILLELKRHAPLPVAELSAEPGIGVGAPDWPDAVGTVRLFELPNIGSPAASAPRLSIAGAGSNDGWRGADCWIVPWAGAEPIPIGMVRPARGLGELAEPLGPGSGALFDLSNSIEVRLANPAMTLESVTDAALLGGANRAMVGGELLQFGVADVVGAGRWRLSRLLRGRAGTVCDAAHPAGTFFVLLDDPALLALPEPLAELAESGAAIFQWAPRGGARLTEVGVPAAGRALRPLAPVHGQVRADGIGGVTISWVRRSRVDTGWRDHIDLPLGESREAWRITLSPPIPGIGPWESATSAWAIDAAELAAVPARHMIEIRQAGDFALSPSLSLPLT